MSHNTEEPIVIGGVPVQETLQRDLSAVAAGMVARHRRELPDYQRLPVEVLRDDVTAISRDAVGFYVDWLRNGGAPSDEQLARIARSAARRAEEGLPLPAVIAAYLNGFEDVLGHLTRKATPEDLDQVLRLTGRIFDFLRATTGAVAAGYVDEVRSSVGQERDARRTLLSALLSDSATDSLARAAGVGLSRNYLVLELRFGAHPDLAEQDVNPDIVNRRMVRRLLESIDRATEGTALTSADSSGGLVLAPVDHSVDWADWTKIISASGGAAGVTVTAAGAIATVSEIQSAAALVLEILEVVAWFERPAGLYRLDDVLVEYQLTRPGEARMRLAALLDPLQRHSDLPGTLAGYLANDRNRRRTAALLHVHPNTIDYRLRRIAELTGIDPTHTAGIQRLSAAIAAGRAEAARNPGESAAPHSLIAR